MDELWGEEHRVFATNLVFLAVNGAVLLNLWVLLLVLFF
jgi:hypothetical protein